MATEIIRGLKKKLKILTAIILVLLLVIASLVTCFFVRPKGIYPREQNSMVMAEVKPLYINKNVDEYKPIKKRRYKGEKVNFI